MKAGLAQLIFGLKALQALKLIPKVRPVVFINSDEEIGSRESTRHIKRLARRADRALILEPALGPEGALKTARKGVGKFSIRVKGKAPHAGLEPGAGASAILELSHVIQKLFAMNDASRGITVNVGMIDGGLRPNVVAPESTAIVDVRVLTRRDAEDIESRIRALTATTPGATLEIEGGIGRPPMERTEGNRILWEAARRVGQELGIVLSEDTAGGVRMAIRRASIRRHSMGSAPSAVARTQTMNSSIWTALLSARRFWRSSCWSRRSRAASAGGGWQRVGPRVKPGLSGPDHMTERSLALGSPRNLLASPSCRRASSRSSVTSMSIHVRPAP